MNHLDSTRLQSSLACLNEQLELADAPLAELVVCGGSALIAMDLVRRTTCDVDVVAMIEQGGLVNSETLPDYLVTAARRVSECLHLPADWLNSGPASQFNTGFLDGFQERLQKQVVGNRLIVHFISRRDQIFFKTYASADRGGYHVADLLALQPTSEELLAAARWCMTQDVSEAFREILVSMFKQLGWNDVSEGI